LPQPPAPFHDLPPGVRTVEVAANPLRLQEPGEEPLFKRVLRQTRRLVERNRYVVTVHALEKLVADELDARDVKQCILNGRIILRQWDTTTREWKYLVLGKTGFGQRAVVVTKIAVTGKLVIITVYLL
jgi:hypothetical protein